MRPISPWVREALFWVGVGPILCAILLSPLLYAALILLHVWLIYTPGGSVWMSVVAILILLAVTPLMLRVWWSCFSQAILNRSDP